MSATALRQTVTTLITAAVTTATVVQNNVDAATALRVLNANRTALVTVGWFRQIRTNISHAVLFRATGELDVTVWALSPEQLDTTLESVHAALLTDVDWVSGFEAVESLETAYDYRDAGDVTVSVAVIRITCRWAEDYPPTLPPLETVAITTKLGNTTANAVTLNLED
jgi:hypothetical protein